MQDRYGLIWPGKDRARALVLEEARGALVPDVAASDGFDQGRHVVVEGENLAVLRLLQPAYAEAFKLIYIDPPYNTGRQFIYPDDYRESVSSWVDQVGSRQDVGGRYHSRWLTMMYPRLALARRLLRHDGLIAVSIDDHEVHNLRLLLDETFGPENFVAQLIWKKKSGGGGDVDLFVIDHEYVLVYARGPGATVGLDREAKVTTVYAHVDEEGRRYSLERLDKRTLGYVQSLDFPIVGPDGTEYRVEHADPQNKVTRWRWSKDTVRERYDELVFRKGCVYTRNYAKEGARPRSLLVDERFGRTRSGKADLKRLFGADVHDFPKPVRLLAWLVSVMTSGDDLVLDFFAGAGTTAEGVLEANRKDGGQRRSVLVQLPHPVPATSAAATRGLSSIADTCRERLRRALEARECGDGFRAFRLADEAAPAWDVEHGVSVSGLREALEERPIEASLRLAWELALAAGARLDDRCAEVAAGTWRIGEVAVALGEVDVDVLEGARRVIVRDGAVSDEELRRMRLELDADAVWTV